MQFMEKKIFKTVEELAIYLNDYSWDNELEEFVHLDEYDWRDFEVEGMKQLYVDYESDIHWEDCVCAIFVSDKEIKYIWVTEDGEGLYDVDTVDREKLSEALREYADYIENGGFFNFEKWFLNTHYNTLNVLVWFNIINEMSTSEYICLINEMK